MKLARRATGRRDIIAFVGGFHGRTYGALSLTASKAAYRRGMGPLLPGVHHIRYPYCFRYCSHCRRTTCASWSSASSSCSSPPPRRPETVAAIVVEPVQGEGGYVVPPAAFLPHAAPGVRRARDHARRRRGADAASAAPGKHVRGRALNACRARHHVPRQGARERDADRRDGRRPSGDERVSRGRARHHLRRQRGRLRGRRGGHRDA